MTDKTEKHTQDATASVQPGDLTKQLIDCREKAGMDIEKAAESMHLSRSLVNALEMESFDELPEPPYIRGYLRSYAKLGDIDPTPLIRTYEILRGANPDANFHHFSPATSMNKVTSPAISPEIMRMLGIVALAILFGLLSMIPAVQNWAQDIWTTFSAQTQQSLQSRTGNENLKPNLGGVISSDNAHPNPVNTAVTTTISSLADRPPLEDEITLPINNPSIPEKANETEPSQSNTATTVAATTNDTRTSKSDTPPDKPSTNSDIKTQIASLDKTDKTESAPDKTKNKIESSETKPSQKPVVATEKTAVKPPIEKPIEKPLAATEAKQPIDGGVTVRLEFIDEVWMEVRDKRGKKLFSALNSAGTIREFSAYTPLSFKIGNVRGVALYLNGQFYDTRSFITGGTVAKFRVE